ncbi:MAG: hypothetical protein JW986_00640 [Methanotrichaceae archaeon]|nr:hypothetical protein [Methanotrichaceae archaeon]
MIAEVATAADAENADSLLGVEVERASDLSVSDLSITYSDDADGQGPASQDSGVIGTDIAIPPTDTAVTSAENPATQANISVSLISMEDLYLDLQNGSSIILLDASNDPAGFIPGAISLPTLSLVDEERVLRPISELIEIIEAAGVSFDQPVVVYGDCMECADSAFLYWALRYVGLDQVSLMDGDLTAWASRGYPTEPMSATMPPGDIAGISPRPWLLAEYQSVSAGELQLVDARLPDNYDLGSIGSAINVPSDSMIDPDYGIFKGAEALNETFSSLSMDEPVAVFTSNGGKAALVWFALMETGFDARLYTYSDWLKNQSEDQSTAEDANTSAIAKSDLAESMLVQSESAPELPVAPLPEPFDFFSDLSPECFGMY